MFYKANEWIKTETYMAKKPLIKKELRLALWDNKSGYKNTLKYLKLFSGISGKLNWMLK